MLTELHDLPFKTFINFDDNRARDGISLRDDFVCEKDIFDEYLYEFRDHPCCVLEVLVALAIRIEDEYIGDPRDRHPELIFWEMLCNLELDRYPNRSFDYWEIYDIVQIWLNREFSRDGNGSIFPLKSTQRDQRAIEIWDQMNEYLFENYPM